ncbi:MAG TPA: SymE family type I addiction module toxin [Thermoanaerobaculia bacterium]|nr:SymE family type I addiction module toxin [Thermoanaerobaculia bacterium]
MRSAHDSKPVPLEPAARNVGRVGRASVITVTGFRLPQLKLVGDWLARAGFDVGTWAEVHAETGRIVIEAQGHIAEPGAREERSERRRALRA